MSDESRTAKLYNVFSDRAGAVASRRWPGSAVREVHSIQGGHSGLTLGGVLTRPHQGDLEIILKFAPEGRPPIGRHDVLRQARAIDALKAVPGVAAPPLVFADTDDQGPMFATELVQGEALEPIMDAPGQLRLPSIVRSRMLTAARMLGVMSKAVLPTTITSDAAIRRPLDELERWVPVVAKVDPSLTKGSEELERLLRSAPPSQTETVALVHGDYRLGNMLFDDRKPTGIIDWEIWSLGDPRVDLGWLVLFTSAENLPGIAVDVEGMPTSQEVMHEFEQATGEPAQHMAWFEALASYRMAAISGDNLRRHREGRFIDYFQEQLPPSIVRSMERGLDLARRAVEEKA